MIEESQETQGSEQGNALESMQGSSLEAAQEENAHDPLNFTAVYEIPVQISAVLGRTIMPVSQLLKLGRGAIIELDTRVGEAVEIFVNNKLVAKGEVIVIEDRLGITMTEMIKSPISTK